MPASPLSARGLRGNAAGRERAGVLGVAALVVAVIAGYIAVTRFETGLDPERNMLPYQALARTLPLSEQEMFRTLQHALLGAEGARARTARWPETSALAHEGIAPFAPGAASGDPPYQWERFQDRQIIDYLGIPREPSAPAWLLMIQEPAPGALPDPAPNDEEHHRLPDGTVLHVYVWMHRYGGRLAFRFAPEPQANGWTQILSAPSPVRR